MKTKPIIVTSILAAAIVFSIDMMIGNYQIAWRHAPYILIYSLSFSIGNMLYFSFIDKFLSWYKNPEKTLIISILGVIPLNALIYYSLNLFFQVIIYGQSLQAFNQHINLLDYTIVILFALLIDLFFIIRFSFKKIRETQLKSEQLKTQNERIKFESLKAQLDPHFLFNNLNVLTALISENPEKAEAFTLKLSDIYLYVLTQKNKNLVRLKDEINFAKNYLDLLKMRFEDSLNYSLPKPVNPKAMIPMLSLQILLENTIKHNKLSSEQPLNITIKIKKGNIWVQNNRIPKETDNNSLKIGLQNLKERYKLLNSQIEIEQTKENFIVKLPIFK